jgi:acyl-coenzyme A synthetase/AMP-(fatty) acid ligase
LGYWRASSETEACFRNGKLYTGDLATIDEDGFIYIVDRIRDFLKCGGKRVSSLQIERVLLEFGELAEAAVVGIPDSLLGEAVKAFVVPSNGNTQLEDRLQAFCERRLPSQLVPKEIVVLASLPKNEAGKISKSALKQAHLCAGLKSSAI